MYDDLLAYQADLYQYYIDLGWDTQQPFEEWFTEGNYTAPNINAATVTAADIDSGTKAKVTQAVATAKSNGDKKWETYLNYFLKYGGQALTILTKTGIIPTANVNNLLNRNISDEALTSNVKAAASVAPSTRSTTTFDLSGVLPWVAGAAGLYFLVKLTDNQPQNKKSK